MCVLFGVYYGVLFEVYCAGGGTVPPNHPGGMANI